MYNSDVVTLTALIYFDNIALKCESNITLTLGEKKVFLMLTQNKSVFVHHQGQETF